MPDPAEEEADYRAHASGSALELASSAFLATEVDLSGDIADYDLKYALDVRGYLEALQSATREARKQLDRFIAGKLEGVQYYRHRDQIIRPGQSGTWKVTNAEGLRTFLTDIDGWELVNLAAPGAITVTRLRQYLLSTNDGDVNAVDTFMERVPSGGPVTILRLEDAPKKAQRLEPGDSIAVPLKGVK